MDLPDQNFGKDLQEGFQPDWQYWLSLPYWATHQAIALSLGIDPDCVDEQSQQWRGYNENDWQTWLKGFLDTFQKRNEILSAWINIPNIDSGLLEDSTHQTELVPLHGEESFERDITKVKPTSFVRFCARLKWELPAEMLEWAGESASPAPSPSGRWPWGDFETPALTHLEMAARKFWAEGYDPKTAESWRKKEIVLAWLKQECGCTLNEAEAIDLILRPKDIKRGPTAKKG